MAHLQDNNLFDTLYCSEQHWEDDQDDVSDGFSDESPHPPLTLLDEDLFWDPQELISLSSNQVKNPLCDGLASDSSVESARAEAVEWILSAQTHHGFSASTSVLAVNYLDRFLSTFRLEADKPWVSQLAAVACLSLAAKVEETQVPLLLDLQVDETRFLFEAKTIQQMELLLLSALGWKMNPVTPLSYLDYFARRLGLKDYNVCWEFLRRSEQLILSLIPDIRSMSYVPSVLATAVMLHVFNTGDLCLGVEDHSRLFDILDIEKDKVDECGRLVLEHSLRMVRSRKRKFGSWSVPGSPNAVLEMCFSPESSNDSWAVMASESIKRRAEAED